MSLPKMSVFSGLKLSRAIALLVLMILTLAGSTVARAQDLTNATGLELRGLVEAANKQIQAGKTNEADLADQIKSFDTFSAKYAKTDPDNAAMALYMKAMLYIQVLNENDKGAVTLKALKAAFPDTKPGMGADHVLAALAAAAKPPAAPDPVTAEINAVVARINAKVTAGKNTEADFADEMKSYDDILARHAGEKTEALATVLAAKAQFYGELFNDADKALQAFQQLKRDFPDTRAGKQADEAISQLEDMAAQQKVLQKIKDGLALGTKFPDFSETDLNGKPLSVSQYKGKVVLIDFWATWCPPCLREFPNTLKIYKKYHDQGFDIIGISLDDNRGQLERFLKENEVPWQQFFDGQGRENKLAVKYAADAPPMFYLLDRTGTIIGFDRYPDALGKMRGDDLDKAVAAALARK